VSENAELRIPELDWSHRSATDELEGVEWIDSGLDVSRPHFQRIGDRFHGPTLAKFVPPAIARAALAAQQKGDGTLLEGMQLLMGRIAWLVRTRPWFWTEVSPVPRLLASLAEAHGIDRVVHRDDPAVLARIVARLLVWRRRRGELEATLRMLDEAAEIVPHERLRDLRGHGPTPDELVDEVLVCHRAEWWEARRGANPKVVPRIEAGFVRFQDPDDPGFPLLREDVLAVANTDQPLERSVSRMLPGWLTIRPVLQSPGDDVALAEDADAATPEAPADLEESK